MKIIKIFRTIQNNQITYFDTCLSKVKMEVKFYGTIERTKTSNYERFRTP